MDCLRAVTDRFFPDWVRKFLSEDLALGFPKYCIESSTPLDFHSLTPPAAPVNLNPLPVDLTVALSSIAIGAPE